MEHKDHQKANDKTAAHYALARAINFSYPHLKQATARHGPSKIVLVDKIKASQDSRAQAFLQVTFDRFEVAATLHRYVSVSIIMTQVRWPRPSPRFIKLLNDSSDPARL